MGYFCVRYEKFQGYFLDAEFCKEVKNDLYMYVKSPGIGD